MSAIDQIERELEDLRKRFSQAFQVLDSFSQLQEQLTQTQQEFEQSLNRTKDALQETSMPSQFHEALTQLESQLDAKYAQLHTELLDLRHSYESTTYDLQDQLHQERDQLKQLAQSPANAPSADHNKLDWLENSMQDLSNLIYADRSALQHLDRRLNHVKRVTDIMTIVGASGFFIMTIIMFVIRTS